MKKILRAVINRGRLALEAVQFLRNIKDDNTTQEGGAHVLIKSKRHWFRAAAGKDSSTP